MIFHKGIDSYGHITLTTDSLNGLRYQVGRGPSEAKRIGIIGSNIFGALDITVPDCFEVSDEADGIFTTTLQLEPTETKIRKMVYFRLKGDLAIGEYNQTTYKKSTL